eukprot:761707-Hanusia_phi.AAC.2
MTTLYWTAGEDREEAEDQRFDFHEFPGPREGDGRGGFHWWACKGMTGWNDTCLSERIDFLGVFSDSSKRSASLAEDSAQNASTTGVESQEAMMIQKLGSDVMKKFDFLGVLSTEVATESIDDPGAFDDDMDSVAFLEVWNELKEQKAPSDNKTSPDTAMRNKMNPKSLNIVDLLKSNEEMMKKAGGSALGSEILLNTLAKLRPSVSSFVIVDGGDGATDDGGAGGDDADIDLDLDDHCNEPNSLDCPTSRLQSPHRKSYPSQET